MRSQNQLITVQDNPILVHFAKTVKRSVIAERGIYQDRMELFSSILERCYEQFPELTRKVRIRKTEIQLQTRGIPATESVLETDLRTSDHQTDVAHRFLVKKAYRVAASVAHPDKGGSDDEFAAVLAAYKAGDLESLNEFVLSKQKGVVDQITHWLNEVQKPEIQWRKFTSTPEYKIVQAEMSGKPELAKQQAQKVLKMMLLILDQQLFQTVKRNIDDNRNQEKSY